ncbi:MAG: hypothetical protein IID35_01675, partial [Planctomycetes bacterium]|nr:hypothetical protein [Planctomycetota bacterium]
MADQIDRKRGSVDWAHIAALLLLVGAALFLRTWFVYAKCFPGDFVNFQGTDPWYHVRAIENLIHNFPHRIALDPYALQPGGQHVAVAPLFDLMVAGVALVLGAGSPSTQLTHTVCAWFPAVLGALITLPAYLLGRSLGGPRTGLLTAAIIAVMPGAMLKASLLGYTDHHVAECMFSLLTVGFLIRALQQIHPRHNTRAPSFLPGQGGMKESFPRARSGTAPVPCERATDCPP